MPQVRNALLKDADWLHMQYYDLNKSIVEIAEIVGCSPSAVGRAMRDGKVYARSPYQTRKIRGTPRKRQFPLLDDGEWLEARYVGDQMSTEEIAALLGCSAVPVLRALKRFNIPRRTPGLIRSGRNRSDRNPELYDPEWLRRRYIVERKSPAEIAVEVNVAESTVIGALARYRIRKKEPLTRDPEAAKAQPRTRRKSGGYVEVWTPDHPYSKSGYVAEHRLVAERELGRYLTAREVVHHINEQPADNRPENLMVFPNNGAHMSFHANPPAWVPRCSCCGKPHPESLVGRPDGVPMEWSGS